MNMNNPWARRRKNARPHKATRYNSTSGTMRTASTEDFTDKHGNINASDKQDLANAISTMMRIASQPELLGDNIQNAEAAAESSYSRDPERIEAQINMLRNSAGDPQAEMVIGETLGDSVLETMGRSGIARNILQFQQVPQGQDARWRMRKKDVVAHIITSSGQVIPSEVRDNYVYPRSYQLTAAVLIEDAELEHSDGALLDEKYQDLLEQIFRQEDLRFKALCDQLAPTANNVVQFNGFNPTVFSGLRTQIRQQGIQPQNAVMSVDLWDDLIAGADFTAWWSEVHKYEIIQNGSLGSLLNVNLMTDGFRHPALRVLEEGEIYFFGPANTLGGIAQHGELKTRATDRYNLNEAKRGWFFNLIESITLLNPRALSKGERA